MVLALGALAGLVAFASCEEGKPEPTAEEKAKAAEEAARPTCVNIAKKQARLCCAPGQKSSMPKGYSPEEMAGTDFKQWCSDGDKPVSPYLVWTDQTKLQCAPDTKLAVADWKDDEDFGTEYVCMKGDVKEGQTMRYHPTGERYELATYKAGKLEGPSLRYNLNGTKEAEGNYVNGERDGRWTHWDKEKNKIREDDWKLGKRDGLSVAYWNNGTKRYEMPFTDDKVHGVWTEWWYEGNMQATGAKEMGKSVGLYTSWWGNGKEAVKGERKGEVACGAWECWTQTSEPRPCFEGVPEETSEFAACKASKTGATCPPCDKVE